MIKNGNSLEMLKEIKSDTVDCMVTDPPYGISFMSKDWDKAVPDVAIWRECLRVMKPGAFAFVMCSPRSDVQAEMVIKLKEAGFEVNFSPVYWTFSQGFPKAMNISKAVDRKFHELAWRALYRFVYDEVFRPVGITQRIYEKFVDLKDIAIGDVGFEREITGIDQKFGRGDSGIYQMNVNGENKHVFQRKDEPTSEEAKRLDGSYAGFQPKPGIEVIIVAMKPLSEKTYVDQALKNGKGITWLDDGRIPYADNQDFEKRKRGTLKSPPFGRNGIYDMMSRETQGIIDIDQYLNESDRFPANLLVQDNVIDNGIVTKSGTLLKKHTITKGQTGSFTPDDWTEKEQHPSKDYPSDEGSLSRYFSLDSWYSKNIEELPDYVQRIFPFLYVPKPSSGERDEDLENLTDGIHGHGNLGNSKGLERFNSTAKNIHPTVKPLKLMSYLVTIGSRSGDTILDPFMGSGTTGVASKILHRDFIGFEIEGKYFEIAQQRIENKVAKGDISLFEEDE